MKLLEWKPSYSVGVRELDEQHETLLGLINGLAGENPDHGSKRCFVALNDLVKYAQIHFKAEENLMRLHVFPGLGAHEKEHEAFAESVFEFNQSLADGSPGVFSVLLSFLKDWYITHVLGTDKEYKEFFETKKVT